MNIVALFTAALLLWIQADNAALLTRLKTLDNAAAPRVIAAETSATREILDRLIDQVDASVHSDRQRPEQRRVQYDREALTLGLRLGSLFGRATGDRTYRQALRSTKTAPRRHSVAQRPPIPRGVGAADGRAGPGAGPWRQMASGHYSRESRLRSSGARARIQEALAQSERAAEIASTLDDKARGLTLYNLASVHLHLKNFQRSVGYSRAGSGRQPEGRRQIMGGEQPAQPRRRPSAARRSRGLATRPSSRRSVCWRQRAIVLAPAARSTTWVVLAMDQERYEPAAAYLERALPIIRSRRHPAFARDRTGSRSGTRIPIEVSALQMLVDIYSRTGQQDRLTDTYGGAAQDQRPLRDPAGHSHKTPQ